MENLVFYCLVTHDRPGDKLRKKADVQGQVKIVALQADLSPVQVNQVGKDLESVKADANGQRDGGQVQGQGQHSLQIVAKEVQILKHKQVSGKQYDPRKEGCPAPGRMAFLAQMLHQQAAGIGHKGGQQQ